MTHDRWQERLGPYLDGEVPAGEAREIERHLDSCAGCRTRIGQMRHLSESIRGLDRIPMPADLKATLSREARRAEVASTAGRSTARRLIITRPWALASLGAAALVVTVIVVAPVNLHREATPPSAVLTSSQDRAAEPAQDSGDVTSSMPSARDLQGKGKPLPSPEIAPQKVREKEVRRTLAARPAAEAGQAPQQPPVQPPVAMPAPREDRSAAGSGTRPDTIDEVEIMMSRAEAPAPSFGAAREEFTLPRQPARHHVVARFATELIRPQEGPALLAPIVGAEPPDLKEAPASVTGTALTASAGKAAAAPVAAREAAMLSLVFLVSLDSGGRIVSADLEGARTVDARIVELTRSLLLAASITPHSPADPSLVVIEVKLPATP